MAMCGMTAGDALGWLGMQSMSRNLTLHEVAASLVADHAAIVEKADDGPPVPAG